MTQYQPPSVTADAERRAPRGETAEAVYQQMYQLAHRLGPNAKLPSVRALRERLGVSQATLESAFVRLERQRVLLRRERSGIYVASQLRERNVCLLCSPDFLLLHGQSPFWSLLLEQSRLFAQKAEMRLTICFTSDIPVQQASPTDTAAQEISFIPEWLASDVMEGRVQGVIAVGVQDGVARWLEARGIPVVAYAGPARATVVTHRSDVLRQGVAALVNHGCRRICLLPIHGRGTDDGRILPREDQGDFQAALEAHGLTLADHGWICLPFQGCPYERWHFPSQVEAGFAAAEVIFGESNDGSRPWARPDGIVSLNDMQTQGLLMGMTRAGLAPDDTLRIATHANAHSPPLLGWQERLIRLEYDPSEIMQSLFEILDTLIPPPGEDGTRDPNFVPLETQQSVRNIAPRLILPSENL